MFAAVNQMIWGPTVQRSHDLGTTWLSPQEPPRFTSGAAETIDQVWHLAPGRDGEPGVVYLGVAPAGLFKSDDYGSTWQEVASLSKHSSRDQWQPGLPVNPGVSGKKLDLFTSPDVVGAGMLWKARRYRQQTNLARRPLKYRPPAGS